MKNILFYAAVGGVLIAALRLIEMARFKVLYKNPLFNVGMTIIEVLPVGLIVTLVSAAILRRKAPAAA